jgi:hypothetical protein
MEVLQTRDKAELGLARMIAQRARGETICRSSAKTRQLVRVRLDHVNHAGEASGVRGSFGSTTRSSSVGMCVGNGLNLRWSRSRPRLGRASWLELGALRLPLSDECGVKGRVGFAAGEAAERSEQTEWLPDRLVAGETPERAPRRLGPGRVRSRPVHHVLDIEAFFGRGTGPPVRVITTFVPRTRRFHRPIMVSHGDARV